MILTGWRKCGIVVFAVREGIIKYVALAGVIFAVGAIVGGSMAQSVTERGAQHDADQYQGMIVACRTELLAKEALLPVCDEQMSQTPCEMPADVHTQHDWDQLARGTR
jgi:hypothetical protein